MDNPEIEKQPLTSNKPSLVSNLLSNKKLLVIAGVVLLVVVLIAILLLSRDKQPDLNKQVVENANRAPLQEIPAPATDDYSKALIEADRLSGSNDAGAISVLEPLANKETDPKKLYPLTLRLGDLYFKGGNWTSAITWYEKALQTGEPGSENVYEMIGAAAEKSGNKSKAIDSYKKLVEIIQKNQQGKIAQDNIAKYQELIKNLGGQ